MKKKFTRKIRKNKRTTQRRKNQSYKRMRGGGMMMFAQRKKIMKLLKNLIINNLSEDDKNILCAKQQTTPTPMATEKHPLSSQQELLKNGENVDELINKLYETFISEPTNGKYQYYAGLFKLHNTIIGELKNKNITFFDGINQTSVLDILSPSDFKNSLLSSSKKLVGGIMISDTLVYSMFALSVKFVSVLDSFAPGSIVYTVDPVECPPRANV